MFLELDTTKRRHSFYYNTFPFLGWIDTPDSSVKLNYFKAVTASVIGHTMQAFYTNFYTGYHLLTQKYLPPQNLKQLGLYMKNIKNIGGQRDRLKRRLYFGVGLSLFEVGPRFTTMRWLTEGIPENPQGFNFNYWRKPLPILLGSIVTCWMRAPLEIAYKAYKCDLKFPQELRNGYTSITDAFIKLARRDPALLFQGSLPTMVGIFLQTLFAYFAFDNLLDNGHVFWDFHGFSYHWLRTGFAAASAALGLAISYPYQVIVRKMVETSPQVQQEKVFKGSYRRALIFYAYYTQRNYGYVGFANFFHKNFIWLTMTLWMCDTLKMHKRWTSNPTDHPYTNSFGNFMI